MIRRDDSLAPELEWSDEAEVPEYKLYSAREIAETLGVVERTVRRWIQAGRLPAQKTHGVYRVRMEDAREVFDSSRAGVVLDRGTMGARIEWLEAENDRLWAMLERAIARV